MSRPFTDEGDSILLPIVASMRRPVRVKTVLFFLSVDSYFLAEPPLSPKLVLIAINVRSDVGSSHPSTLTGYGGVRLTNFAGRGYRHT